MRSSFVYYNVVAHQNVGSEQEPFWISVSASGVVKDTPAKLGKIFQQNPQLLSCGRIMKITYEPI